MELTRELSGKELTRGDHGVRAEVAHRVAWGGVALRKATQEDPEHMTDGAVFDPDHGWILWNE